MLYENPFTTLAGLLRGLRDRMAAEAGLGPERRPSPHLAEVLGSLMGLVTQCEHLAGRADALERADPEAFQALQRALEKAA